LHEAYILSDRTYTSNLGFPPRGIETLQCNGSRWVVLMRYCYINKKDIEPSEVAALRCGHSITHHVLVHGLHLWCLQSVLRLHHVPMHLWHRRPAHSTFADDLGASDNGLQWSLTVNILSPKNSSNRLPEPFLPCQVNWLLETPSQDPEKLSHLHDLPRPFHF